MLGKAHFRPRRDAAPPIYFQRSRRYAPWPTFCSAESLLPTSNTCGHLSPYLADFLFHPCSTAYLINDCSKGAPAVGSQAPASSPCFIFVRRGFSKQLPRLGFNYYLRPRRCSPERRIRLRLFRERRSFLHRRLYAKTAGKKDSRARQWN